MGALIDAKMQRLLREGHDEVSIIGEMFDCMPFFKMLLDSGQDTMDELCRRFAGFYHYGVVSPNPRKFRHPNSSPARMASRSMTYPSPRSGVAQHNVLVQERGDAGHGTFGIG